MGIEKMKSLVIAFNTLMVARSLARRPLFKVEERSLTLIPEPARSNDNAGEAEEEENLNARKVYGISIAVVLIIFIVVIAVLLKAYLEMSAPRQQPKFG